MLFNFSSLGFVYKIMHPITKEIVYIGATESPESRFYCHLHNKKDTPLTRWFSCLRNTNLTPLFEIIQICDRYQRFQEERKWINYYSLNGVELLNRKQGKKQTI